MSAPGSSRGTMGNWKNRLSFPLVCRGYPKMLLDAKNHVYAHIWRKISAFQSGDGSDTHAEESGHLPFGQAVLAAKVRDISHEIVKTVIHFCGSVE